MEECTMLPKDRVYRLCAALLILTVAVSVPLAATAEESEYAINDLDGPVNSSTATISGSIDGGDFTGLTVHFEGDVTGSASVDPASGAFLVTLPAISGVAEAVLKDGAIELAREEFDLYE